MNFKEFSAYVEVSESSTADQGCCNYI